VSQRVNRDSRVLVCGAGGLVGSALVRRLRSGGYERILQPTRQEVDLSDSRAVQYYFQSVKPEYVFMAAAKVGGILANRDFPADFIRDNLAIELAIVEASRRSGVTKLLMLGSSCIYPRESPQPIREEYLLTGPLEPTNAPYAVAKIAGIMLCQSYAKQYGVRYISAMPTNIYGPGDNFDLQSSHVIPALIRKFHEAKDNRAPAVVVWGTGRVKREFLHVDDLADACLFLMERYEDMAPINVGMGEDVSVAELATLIGQIVGYAGEVQFDSTKPDGTPRKLLDVSRLSSLGWKATTSLQVGLVNTYRWYLQSKQSGAGSRGIGVESTGATA
jgi:GDP-L-fucose synthase